MDKANDIDKAIAAAPDGRGRPRQHPLLKTRALGCALPAWMITWLDEEAARRQCSRAQVITTAILGYYKPPGVRILANGNVVVRKTKQRTKAED